MRWFCGIRTRPQWLKRRALSKLWWRDVLWRRLPKARSGESAETRARAKVVKPRLRQPAPYFCIDAGPIRLVGIDTGISGDIDAAQGSWLRRVSHGPRPKVLVTGKPIYVDGK